MKNLLLAGTLSFCCGLLASEVLPLIPYPAEVEISGTSYDFVIDNNTSLYCRADSPEFRRKTELLRNFLASGTMLGFSDYNEEKNFIRVIHDPELAVFGKEAYSIAVSSDGVTIGAAFPEGVFYAGQTLAQLLPADFFASGNKSGVKWTLKSGVKIKDYPRFAWRAFMLDEARHFFGEAMVKRMIDQMARYKFNVLHWHLTDDVGWRIEIKKYPLLTQKASKRSDTEIGDHHSGRREGRPHQGYYTQEQIKRIVAYAAERNITVVPEIDVPSHSSAAIYAYPELSFTKVPVMPAAFASGPALDPTRESTYEFISGVLDEVVEMFPSGVIHMGGDEIRFNSHWRDNPAIINFMKEKKLDNLTDVQVVFSNRVSQIVRNKGRTMMGWNEIIGSDLHGAAISGATEELDPAAVVHFWKGSVELARIAAERGHKVVNSTHDSTYLNYNYFMISLKKAYSFEPVFGGLDDKYHKNVIGMGCQLWTEWVADADSLDYQVFPRFCAYSEVAWSPAARRPYEDFLRRMEADAARLANCGVNYNADAMLDLTHEKLAALVKLGGWNPEELAGGRTDLDFDVTQTMKQPGKYKVIFLYSKGGKALSIRSVTLFDADGRRLSADKHNGATGISNLDSVYRIEVPANAIGKSLKLRAAVSGDGGSDSYGVIYLDRE